MTLWLVLSLAARAACDSISFVRAVDDADAAFAAMDGDAFDLAAASLDETLACMSEPISPTHAVAVHRTRALAAFLAGDDAATVSSFQAALAAMPGYELPQDIAPIGHPLRARFEDARLFSAGGQADLPEPASGWITVDGARTRIAPTGRAFVFQRFDDSAAVVDTAYVAVGRPLPSYPVREAAPPVPDRTPLARQPVSVPLAVGVALDVVAAGLYSYAFVTRAHYEEAKRVGDLDRIKSSHLTTNLLVGVSIGTGVVGTSLVVVSF